MTNIFQDYLYALAVSYIFHGSCSYIKIEAIYDNLEDAQKALDSKAWKKSTGKCINPYFSQTATIYKMERIQGKKAKATFIDDIVEEKK